MKLALSYAGLVSAVALAIHYLTDRLLVVTLISYGPRWLLALPLIPLTIFAVAAPPKQMPVTFASLATAAVVLVFGVLDCRLGCVRAAGAPSIRLMTQNVGGSGVKADQLNDFLVRHHVDVAAIQECPFYDDGPKAFGWHFFYGGDLCVISRYPFSVLDAADPAQLWRGGRVPLRLEIDFPAGRFQMLIVHFETVRAGLDALRELDLNGLALFERNRRDARAESTFAKARLQPGSPFLVAGDFNLPAESTIYQQVWGDLRNLFSRCGRGFGHTKLTSLYGIRIDHILASDQWECTNAQVLKSPYGGDHRPLIADLQLQYRASAPSTGT